MFEHELASRLHMTVGELRHGRGTPMSAHELTVRWPLFVDYERRMAEARREQQRRGI